MTETGEQVRHLGNYISDVNGRETSRQPPDATAPSAPMTLEKT